MKSQRSGIMADSEAGNSSTWRVWEATVLGRSKCLRGGREEKEKKKLIQFLLSSVKQAEDLWQNTICLHKKLQQLDIDKLESCVMLHLGTSELLVCFFFF